MAAASARFCEKTDVTVYGVDTDFPSRSPQPSSARFPGCAECPSRENEPMPGPMEPSPSDASMPSDGAASARDASARGLGTMAVKKGSPVLSLRASTYVSTRST